MAIKALIFPAELNENMTPPINSQGYRTLIQELIRLDVPILEVGSSSIGKSYSIREFSEECGVNSEFLFVGTEKSEFIEGIPNLKGITGDTAKFSYLKPYWFPDKEEIRRRISNGKLQLESLLTTDGTINALYEKSFSGTGMSSSVKDLKIAIQKYKRTDTSLKAKVESAEQAKKEKEGEGKTAGSKKPSKYIYNDALLYLSTMQGFGNFWLILDEIDKVEKQDKDKYAPLLHIVRERELKGWKLSGLRDYPEYDVKFVTSINKRKARLDAALADPNVDVTDTRIIAIANDLKNMEKESPALYRRFVKIVIRESLYEKSSENSKTLKEGEIDESLGDIKSVVGFDWAKQYEVIRQHLHDCIVDKPVGVATGKVGIGSQTRFDSGKAVTIGKKMAEIKTDEVGRRLKEMNLQWTLGFFPDILFPGGDTQGQGKSFMENDIIENYNKEDSPYDTFLFKILSDNFDPMYWKPMLECIHDKISYSSKSSDSKVSNDVIELYEQAGVSLDSLDNPDENAVSLLVEKYIFKLRFAEKKFMESIANQKGETIIENASGLENTVLKVATDAVRLGFELINASLISKKTPSAVTKMLFSSIPFLQTKLIYNSPYIPHDASLQLIELQDSGIMDLLRVISSQDFKTDTQAKDAATKVFAILEPYRPFVVRYGLGVPSEMVISITDGDYTKVTDEFVNEVIANRPVMTDNLIVSKIKNDKLKMKYFNSISNVQLLDKEVFVNIPGVAMPLLINDFNENGLTPALSDNIKYYTEKYPNRMKKLSGFKKVPVELGEFMRAESDKVLANPSDYMISESDLILA